ncbi:MAG: hypothetical protein LBQ90_07785 [Synergistaceae bacterium]|nr:hypothetical protein [Synergistaceae bacterium]
MTAATLAEARECWRPPRADVAVPESRKSAVLLGAPYDRADHRHRSEREVICGSIPEYGKFCAITRDL